jgi:hypothetical protein
MLSLPKPLEKGQLLLDLFTFLVAETQIKNVSVRDRVQLVWIQTSLSETVA